MTRPDFTRAAVIRDGSMVAAGGIVSAVLATVLTTILGIELGDEGFGVYAFVIATAGLLAAVARVGLDPIVVRDIARSVDEQEAALGSRRPIVTALAITSTVGAAIALIVLLPPVQHALESAGDLDASLVGALVVLFLAQALYTINGESLRGLHHQGEATFVGLPVQRFLSLALVAWVVYATSHRLDPGLAAWLTAAAAAGATAVSGAVLWRHARALPGGRTDRREAADMARAGGPVLVTNVLGIAGGRMPVWVLAILGTLGDAGVFALATAYVTLIRFGHKTMVSTLSPFIATSYHDGSHEALQRRIRIAAAATTTMAIAAAGVMVLGGLFIVPRLFPEGFEDAVAVAAILLVGTVATAASGPASLLLNISGNERSNAVASAIAIGLAAVAIFPAAAAGGAIGAAVVMGASALLNASLTFRYAVLKTGIVTAADFPGLIRTLRPGR